MSVSPAVYVEPHRARFRAVWRNSDGKKLREPFVTREQAELFQSLCRLNPLDQVLAMVRGAHNGDDLTWPPISPEGATDASVVDAPTSARPFSAVLFRPYALDFIGQMTGVTERTRQDALRALENHVFPYFAADDLALTDLRQKERADRSGHRLGPDGQLLSISNWLLWLGKRQGFNNAGAQTAPILKAKTINNLHALLSSILQAAVDDDDRLLDRNPCTSSRLPEVQREEQIYLEHDEFQALLRATPAFFRCLIVFLVGTGVRWGEAAGLSVKHLHLDPANGQPYVEVLVAWRRVLRGRFALGRVKSRCSQRVITLSPMVVALLRAQVAGKGPEEAVFTMREGGRLHHSNFTRILKKAVRTAGLAERTACHALRHTHVAWLISADRTIPMLAISRRLGHSSEAFTSKRYGHLLARVGTDILVAVDAALDPTRPSSPPTEPDLAAGTTTGLFTVPVCDDATGDQTGDAIELDAVDAALPEFEIADGDDLAA